jgi:hypothetical protein
MGEATVAAATAGAGAGVGCAAVAVGSGAAGGAFVGGVAGGGEAGTLRISSGTSGRGQRAASIFSTPRLDRCTAASSSSRWFWSVRCGTSSEMAVRWSRPSATRSRMSGKRRAARAACVRLQVASSDMCRTSVQKVKRLEQALSR